MGYFLGKASVKLLKVNINPPLILTLSILPDVDLLVPMLQHGGPTHSIILLPVMAIPAILVWRKQAIPFLLAIMSHPLLGDYLTRWSPWSGPKGIQLLFPLTFEWFTAGWAGAQVIYVYLEVALFAAFLLLILATKDIRVLVQPHHSNLLLGVPMLAALLVLLQPRFHVPSIPPELTIPHLTLVALLALPMIVDFRFVIRHLHRPSKSSTNPQKV